MLIRTNYNILFRLEKSISILQLRIINTNFARKTVMYQMKTRLFLIIVLIVWCFSLPAHARRFQHVRNVSGKDTAVVKAYMDSLFAYKVKLDSAVRYNGTGFSEFPSDARFFRIFAPLTFYYSVAGDRISKERESSDNVNVAISKALGDIYLNRPELVCATEKDLNKVGALHEEIKTPIRHEVEYVGEDDNSIDETFDIPTEIFVTKPNFWTFGGDYYLQFLQNYVSSNWYKGGESNYSMVASAILLANYNNKQKVTFENKLELKLGFQTSRSDTLHNFKTTEDLIRYTGKLGLQAAKKWYYTLQLVAYTQFMRGYKSNDPLVYSDILSPLNINLSLGMSYKVDAFNGKLKGSIQMAPFAYNFRYVGREELATRYGLDEGEHTMNDFGSECTFDLTWQMSELIKWKTRLYGFTSYHRTEVEWENTISFQFNKYISSNIFIYPRFDDAASKKDDSRGYFQLKEYASLGFSFSF